MTVTKTSPGNFFEDFRIGQALPHAVPRTVTEGDVALHLALYGSRFTYNCADPFAQSLGLPRAPIPDLLTFHIVVGKTVSDLSLNAIANLGYAEMRFHALVYPGDTLGSASTVIGLKQNTGGASGIVYVHTVGLNQRGETVLDFIRWVMVNKRNPQSPAPEPVIPVLLDAVAADTLYVPEGLDAEGYDTSLSGSRFLWDDYEAGERIDHVDGLTIEEAEHAMATRLYQNTARVHTDAIAAGASRHGRRLVYGGYIMSLARALSHNGLANAFKIAAVNGAAHTAPAFAGQTVFAWTEVVEKAAMPGRADFGALRLRTMATFDHTCADFPGRTGPRSWHPAVLLDFDYWALMPRR